MRTLSTLLLLSLFIAPFSSATSATAPSQQSAIYSKTSIHHPVWAKNAMVATQEALATQIGVDILKQGGNAVDAAAAGGYALAVTLSLAGHLGGCGFVMVFV